MSKLNVLIIGFGGTIGMVPDEKGYLKPKKSVKEIVDIVPSLKSIANISFLEMENLDSTNISHKHWTKLAFKIAEIHGRYDGIIVIHGTDTMAYTAGAISLVLGRKLQIPIVFTGSQLPLIDCGSDARFNLEWAMKTIQTAHEEKIWEVMIVFSTFVLRACRAIKISESHFHAFDSPAFPPLARITATGVRFIPEAFRAGRELDISSSKKSAKSLLSKVKPSSKHKSLRIDAPHFQSDIMSVEVVPGLEPDILFEILRSGTCQGLLLKSLGAGHVPTERTYSLLPVIEKAKELKIPVLISTKFVGGKTLTHLYKLGQLALNAGAIPTGDLTDVMAQVKFMWALAQGHRSREKLVEVIETSVVGEITEPKERKV